MSDSFSSVINTVPIQPTGIDRNAIRTIQARYRNDVDDALKAGRDVDKLA